MARGIHAVLAEGGSSNDVKLTGCIATDRARHARMEPEPPLVMPLVVQNV